MKTNDGRTDFGWRSLKTMLHIWLLLLVALLKAILSWALEWIRKLVTNQPHCPIPDVHWVRSDMYPDFPQSSGLENGIW